MKLSFEVANPTTSDIGLCPIIFLHAIFDSKTTWRVVAPQIAYGTGRLVYCVDARNHGDSPQTKDFTIQFMADDIKEFLNERKIAKAILLGNNIGASVAMKLALEAPELIEKLIVESMVPEPYTPHGWKIMLDAILHLRMALRKIREGSNLQETKRAVSNYLALNFGLLVATLKEDNGTLKWEANLDAIEVALRTNEGLDGDLIGTYGGEVAFLYGMAYTKVPNDERISRLFPRAVRVPVQGAAVIPHIEMPISFVKEVVQFINGQSVPES